MQRALTCATLGRSTWLPEDCSTTLLLLKLLTGATVPCEKQATFEPKVRRAACTWTLLAMQAVVECLHSICAGCAVLYGEGQTAHD
jgi:hypothetical protein